MGRALKCSFLIYGDKTIYHDATNPTIAEIRFCRLGYEVVLFFNNSDLDITLYRDQKVHCRFGVDPIECVRTNCTCNSVIKYVENIVSAE